MTNNQVKLDYFCADWLGRVGKWEGSLEGGERNSQLSKLGTLRAWKGTPGALKKIYHQTRDYVQALF